jgi:HEAT repeat protein
MAAANLRIPQGALVSLSKAPVAPVAVFALAALVSGVASSSARAGGPDAPSMTESPRSLTERTEALVGRLRQGTPDTRDDATRELLELASMEDARPAGSEPRPVHEVLQRALVDSDAEVRFRVRRVLGDPEVRVERLIVQLLDPQPTEETRAAKQGLVERSDRGVARAGLVRIAQKSARAGIDPQTSQENEVWQPYGISGGAQLRERRRFHLTVDLLSEITSDDEVNPLLGLLHYKLGDSLGDVISALGSRPQAARPKLRELLGDPDEVTRENAACALGEIGTVEDAPALEVLVHDPSWRVRRAVVTAFEMLPLDAAAVVKVAALANDPDYHVAAAALHLGGTFGQRFVADAAHRIVNTETASAEAKVQAARALGRLGDKTGALRPLLAKLDDTTKVAAWATGAGGDLESLGGVEALLGRDDFSLVPGLYYGMARAGALRWLEEKTRSDQNDVRRLAIQSLGAASGDPDAIASILQKAATQAIERGGARAGDWNDFSTAFRALRDRADDPARKAMGRLLDQALAASSRGSGLDEATLSLAVQCVHQARSTESLRALQQLSERSGRNSRYVRQLAIDAYATLDPQGARESLTKQLAREREDEMRSVIARNLARCGDKAQIQKALEISKAHVARSIPAPGTDNIQYSEALNSEGIDHAYEGNTDEAVFCFQRMRWLRPDNNVAAYNIACVLSLAGRNDDAIRWLRRAMREGWLNWRHIRGDSDLDNILEDPRFKRLIEEMRQQQEIEPWVER